MSKEEKEKGTPRQEMGTPLEIAFTIADRRPEFLLPSSDPSC